MDVYQKIVDDIKKSFVVEGNKHAAKRTKTVMNRYIDLMMDGLFHKMKYIGPGGPRFSITMYSMAYIAYSLRKVSVFSRRHPYYIFKTSLNWSLMRKQSFSFKPMSKLHKEFQERVLDTEKIYNIVENHEKNIL